MCSNTAINVDSPHHLKKSAFSTTARVYGKPLTLNSKEASGHADHEMEVRTKALTFL